MRFWAPVSFVSPADGLLAPGVVWRQESIIGSVFDASADLPAGHGRPSICGAAYVSAQSQLLFADADRFTWGIPA